VVAVVTAAPSRADGGTAAPPPPERVLRGLARGGLVNLAGAGFTGVAGFGVTALVAHGLQREYAGAFFAATALTVLAGGVAKLGTPTGLVYWPARLRATGSPHLLGRYLRAGLVPVAVLSALMAAAIWFAAPQLMRLADPDGAQVHAASLRVLALFLPAMALSDALLAAARGYRALRPTVLLDRIMRPALQLAALAAVVYAGPAGGSPHLAFALAWAAPYAPTALLAARDLRRVHRAALAAPGSAPHTATDDGAATDDAAAEDGGADAGRVGRQFWLFTGPRAVAGVAQLALQRLDVLLVASIAGLPAAALYTVAGRFVIFGQFVNQAISQVIQPRLAERLCVDDRAGASALYQQATAWLVLATWPMYLLVIAAAPGYLSLFGPQYRGGVAVVVVLAAAMLVATGCGAVDSVLAMGGRTTWNLCNVLLALAVMVGVDALLIPRSGAFGAAVGLAAAVIANNVVPLAQVAFVLRLHPFGRATQVAALLSAGSFGVPVAVSRTLPGTAPTVTAMAFALVVFCTGALLLRRVLGLTSLTATNPGEERA
jgi:O-antigen/teichoic acid export membrane protein